MLHTVQDVLCMFKNAKLAIFLMTSVKNGVIRTIITLWNGIRMPLLHNRPITMAARSKA
jgi:hypothetical protein